MFHPSVVFLVLFALCTVSAAAVQFNDRDKDFRAALLNVPLMSLPSRLPILTVKLYNMVKHILHVMVKVGVVGVLH